MAVKMEVSRRRYRFSILLLRVNQQCQTLKTAGCPSLRASLIARFKALSPCCMEQGCKIVLLLLVVALYIISNIAVLKGNSTLKNILPKINIYDKWIYVAIIKLTMQIRYRRILTIKLLISRNVFLQVGGSSKPSSLFYIYVYLLMLTWLPKTVVHMFFLA